MSDHAGLAWSEYLAFTRTLNIPRNESLNPVQRAQHVPSWMCAELIDTEPARARLRRWVEAGGLYAPDTPEVRRRLAAAVSLAAEAPAEGEVRAVLASLPPPMLHHLAANALVTVTGNNVGGWSIPWVPKANASEAVILAIDWTDRPGESKASIVGHECSHAWLEAAAPITVFPADPEAPENGVRVAVMAALTDEALEQRRAHDEALLRVARLFGKVGEVSRRGEDVEVRAARLARRLGFEGRPTDAARCRWVTRLNTWRAADDALARFRDETGA